MSSQQYMGLRQKYKRFRHFAALVSLVVLSNLLIHPYAMAAEVGQQGQCEAPEQQDVQVTACSGQYSELKEVATAPSSKTASKNASAKPSAKTKSTWEPVASMATGVASGTSQLKEKYIGYHSMTAYTSEVAQTDASPCTTANGFNVCKHGIEDTVAANFLPMGTKVKIPDLFGDRVFTVRDRMNRRYSERVDVWMKDKGDALKFGVRTARIVVLK